jgi:hypothetical protein
MTPTYKSGAGMQDAFCTSGSSPTTAADTSLPVSPTAPNTLILRYATADGAS